MSTPVTVRIHKPLDGESLEQGAVVEVRAVGEKTRSRFIKRLIVPVGEDVSRTSHIDLEPGRYEFSAILPSGSVLSETVEVGPTASQPVTLRAETSPHEWLAWQQWSGNASERASVVSLQTNLARAPERVRTALDKVAVDLWRPAAPGSPDPVWQKLATALSELDTGGSIDPASLRLPNDDVKAESLLRDPPYIAVRLPRGTGTSPGRAYVVVRRDHQSMLCAIPWPWYQADGSGEALVEVVVAIEEGLIETAEPGVDRDPTAAVWSVRPAVRDRMMGGILAYFASGAQELARELVSPARNLLFEKMVNPFGAAGGAYVLVDDWVRATSGAGMPSDAPIDWMRWVGNLNHSFPWLPDGAILDAWLALRRRDKTPQLSEVRTVFLEAERRGIPVYTAGVRRLMDGLMLLSGEARRQGASDAEIEAALGRVRRLAWQIDARQPFTCVRLWSA